MLLTAIISRQNEVVNSIQLSSYLIITQDMVQKQRINNFGKILFLSSFVINYFFLKETSSGLFLNSLFFWDLPSLTLQTDAEKYMIIRSLLAKCGIILFFLTAVAAFARVITKKIAPAQDEDPLIIKFLNRLIQNTLEQAAVFISLYAYFLFDKAGNRFNPGQLIVIASWFLWGRIVFFIAYSFGTVINMVSLRSFGMGLNAMVAVLLVQLCFLQNHSLSNHIFSI